MLPGMALPAGLRQLLDFIASREGGYNSMNQGTSGNRIVGSTHNAASILGKNLTDMTIGEVMAQQDAKRLFAAGKYQIIPVTMRFIVDKLKLASSTLFSADVQERMGLGLIEFKRPYAWKYLQGKHSDRDGAMLDLAKEWASLPDPRTGNSFYGGANRAGHTVAQVAAAIDAARRDVMGAGGAPPSAGAGDGKLGTAGASGGSILPVVAVALIAGWLLLRRR